MLTFWHVRRWPLTFRGHALKSTHHIWHTQWITENVRFSTLGFLLDKNCSDEAGLEDGCYGEHIKNCFWLYFWIFSSVNKISSVLTTCMLIIIHTFPPWHEPPPAWVFFCFFSCHLSSLSLSALLKASLSHPHSFHLTRHDSGASAFPCSVISQGPMRSEWEDDWFWRLWNRALRGEHGSARQWRWRKIN